ncbi:MAG: sugar phosphate isomerase/epimerase [Planctomycetia bacterium]|nr:sugar phosphate isomerase/epimerase [Planctomycetia bacterium]
MAVLSISELTTFRWSFEEDVAQVREAGFRAIGVWRQKLAEYGEAKGIELLRKSGLAVSNLQWCGGFTGSDGRSHRDGLEDAREAIELAAALNAGCLIVYSGARGGHTFNHAKRLLRDALKELLPIARKHKVTLALEPMHPDASAECTFLNDPLDALSLIETFHDPHLKLAFDTYHIGLLPDWQAKLKAVAEHIAVVHLGDGTAPVDREQVRTRLGEGIVPLQEILSALQTAGFDGYYDVELVGMNSEPARYPELLAHSRDAFTRLTTLVQLP